jgi:hypothetical protein
MTGHEPPWFPLRDHSRADTVWQCQEEGCDYREHGMADWPLGNGVCEDHPRRALIRKPARG